MTIYAENPNARHEYEIINTYEAGIQLIGTEVKSIRNKQIQIKEGFLKFNAAGDLILYNTYVAPYKFANQKEQTPYRLRTLLLHTEELAEIKAKMTGQRLTIIPLKVYNSPSGLIKIEIGLGRGKRQFEKRRLLRERQIKKDLARTLKKYK